MAFLARLEREPLTIKRFYLQETARHLAENGATAALLVITRFLLESADNEVLQGLLEFLNAKGTMKSDEEIQSQVTFLQ